MTDKNPFKFGSIVNEPFFTNRQQEMEKVTRLLNSENHLIMMSPRRYGKSSLIFKVLSNMKRPHITLDLQLVTGITDLAAQLLRRIFRAFPFERIRQYIKNFRVIPTISVNPVTSEVDINFQPGSNVPGVMEDVLNLFEKLGSKEKRLIVVFDEFQELQNIDPTLFGLFRSVMQHHQNVNYVFLGSQESLIRDIFEKKKSPFYHFGMLMHLGKIPYDHFYNYLFDRFSKLSGLAGKLSEDILSITRSHPYYTQQLAWVTWEMLIKGIDPELLPGNAVEELIGTHDMDYERLWMNFNKSDKKMLIGLSSSDLSPLSDDFLRVNGLGATSTAFSTMKRLAIRGYITKVENQYEIDDPFFLLWIRKRRSA